MRRIFCILAVSAFCAMQANADWTREIEADAFSGETVIYVTNEGRFLEGDSGPTKLIWRKKDGEAELFWSTPSSYICDSEMEVMYRFGDGKPEKAYVSGATSNKAVFFSQPSYVIYEMSKEGKMLLKLTDHCGSLLVSEFVGDPSALIEGFDVFDGKSGWLIDSSGYAKKATGKAAIKFRRIYDGSDDLYFTIDVPELAGKRVSLSEDLSAKVRINGQSFKLKGHHDIDYSDPSNLISKGRVNIMSGKGITSQNLTQLLGDSRTITIEYDGVEYTMDLTDFERAFNYG